MKKPIAHLYRLNMAKWLTCLLLAAMAHPLLAQEASPSGNLDGPHKMASLGYYAPNIFQTGIRMGLSLPLKRWEQDTKRQDVRIHGLNLAPRISYSTQADVQRSYMADAVLEYRWYKPNSRLYPTVGVGLGYTLTRQNTEASVNLGSGEVTFEKRSLHSFLPTLNIGLASNTNKLVGYYFTAFYGRQFTAQEVNTGFLGAEAGVLFNLRKK